MFSFGKSSKNFLALVDCADASYSVASKFPVLVGEQNDCSLKIEGADFKFEVSAEKSGGLTAKLLERGTLLVNGIEPSDVFEVGAVCTLQFGERAAIVQLHHRIAVLSVVGRLQNRHFQRVFLHGGKDIPRQPSEELA